MQNQISNIRNKLVETIIEVKEKFKYVMWKYEMGFEQNKNMVYCPYKSKKQQVKKSESPSCLTIMCN